MLCVASSCTGNGWMRQALLSYLNQNSLTLMILFPIVTGYIFRAWGKVVLREIVMLKTEQQGVCDQLCVPGCLPFWPHHSCPAVCPSSRLWSASRFLKDLRCHQKFCLCQYLSLFPLCFVFLLKNTLSQSALLCIPEIKVGLEMEGQSCVCFCDDYVTTACTFPLLISWS